MPKAIHAFLEITSLFPEDSLKGETSEGLSIELMGQVTDGQSPYIAGLLGRGEE